MKLKKLTTIIALILPISAIAITKPHPAPNEVCNVGSSCAYSLSRDSKRIITTSIPPNNLVYECAATSGDDLDKLKVENLSPSGNNVKAEVKGDGHLTNTPFLNFKNRGPQKGTITYNLQNTDFWSSHSVVYRCVKERISNNQRH